MQVDTKLHLQRYAWFSLILFGTPTVFIGGWFFLEAFYFEVNLLWYFIVSIVVITALMFYLVWSKVSRRIPSVREQEMAELLRSQERFLLLYEHSPVPYLTLDNKGRLIMYNLAAVRLFQSTTDGMMGLEFTDLLRHEDATYLRRIKQDISHGIVIADREVQIETESGERHWVLLSVFLYKEAKQRLVTLVDITHQKEIDTAKSEFVALATHQLRTPVAAIRWNLELLQKQLPSDLPASAEKYVVKIERNILRMIALINDFLNVSKLEMGTFATETKAINLATFCDSIVDEFSQAVSQKQLQLHTSYDPPDLSMQSDERLLHIIVSNLMSNAVKYIGTGGEVFLTYQKINSEVRIEVRDTGMGIPQAELSQLFTKFFRASNARVQQAEGTGLGLYVVQQSVEKLGGTISVTSEENKGTTFVIVLPYRV